MPWQETEDQYNEEWLNESEKEESRSDQPVLSNDQVIQPSPTAGEQPSIEPADGPAWYVIHCYSGYENKVRHNLEQRIETMGMKDRIFDVVIPTQEEIEVKEGKR